MKRGSSWFLYSSIGILIFVGFVYNQPIRAPEEILAQNINYELVCPDKEIPVGTLIDEADKFHQQLITSLFNIPAAAKAQIEQSEILLGLEDEAKVENCTSSCKLEVVSCGLYSCTYKCVAANGCTGKPLSTDAEDKIKSQLAAVNVYYSQVKQANAAIQGLLTNNVASPFAKNCSATCALGPLAVGCTQECTWNTARNHIMNTLAQARRALQACVTPVNQQTQPEEAAQRSDGIISCQEAKFWKILDDTQQQCQTNNFFCCSIQIIK